MADSTAAPIGAQTDNFAFDFVKRLASELSDGVVELPAFPQIAARVRRTLDDPENTALTTARVVGAEPALAAKVLSMANSAAFTFTGEPVTELRSAIIRLGSNHVRSAAISFAMEQLRHAPRLKPIEKTLQQLWDESTRVAAVCYVVAGHAQVNADEAFLMGLLHGIGKLYVWVRACGQGELLKDTEGLEAIADSWCAPIGSAILENWDFTDRISNAVRDQDDREHKHYGNADLTDVLVCSKLLAACGDRRAQMQVAIESAHPFRQVGLDLNLCLVLLEQAAQRITELREALGK